ncbi:hypothetical protein ACS0TY_006731 [Phlomoides rotata]
MSSSYNHSSTSDSDEDELMELINHSLVEQLVCEVKEQRRLLNEMVNASSNTPKRKYINRDREGVHTLLVNDYFSENPTFGMEIRCSAKKGFSPLQKCTVAIRQLTYGGLADHYDEYMRVAESTAIECLFKFCRCVIDVFGPYYLRTPTTTDVQRLYEMHEQRHGFPGMLRSLDCMHLQWKNCPVAWKGQYT